MTGYLTDRAGSATALPALLQWSIKLTDGDPCDAFSLRVVFVPELLGVLREACGFYAVEGGKRVFTGVVDDYEVSLTKKGLLAEVTGRGMAAKLIDTQVRAAEYQSAQLADILNTYVTPCGIEVAEAEQMAPVSEFVVETGYTCWQVLAGFCRHSAGIYPSFTQDGRLLLRRGGKGGSVSISNCAESVWLTDDRYGTVARQIIVNTRNGQTQEAENAEYLARGGSRVQVVGRTGSKVRAIWRTAEQRIEDAARNSRQLSLRIPGVFLAAPGDTAAVWLRELGLEGQYTVRSAESVCDENGYTCLLTMREQ